MKKTFAIAILFLLGTALHAGPVTPERALRVAEHVFSSASATKSVDASSLKIVWDGEFEPATKAAQDPALYVITRPEGGFVMVAGNDNVRPATITCSRCWVSPSRTISRWKVCRRTFDGG